MLGLAAVTRKARRKAGAYRAQLIAAIAALETRHARVQATDRGPRHLGAAARKRISDAQKARWAKQRAGKKH